MLFKNDVSVDKLTNECLWQYVIELVDKYFLFIKKKMIEFGYGEGVTDADLRQMSYLYAYEFMLELMKPHNENLLQQAGFYTLFIRNLEYMSYKKKRKGGEFVSIDDISIFNKFFHTDTLEDSTESNLKIDETLKFLCYYVLSSRQSQLFWHIYRLCDNDCQCDSDLYKVSIMMGGLNRRSVETLYKRGLNRIKDYLSKYHVVEQFKNAPLSEYIEFLYSLPILSDNRHILSHDRQEISPRIRIGEANV